MLLGVASEELGDKMAAVLQRLGTRHSLVVHGRDGLDEISISGASLVWDVTEDKVTPPYEVSPGSFGLKEGSGTEIKGGTPAENAVALRRILEGKKGPLRNVVVINAAAAFLAANTVSHLKRAASLAEETIDNGSALDKLEKMIELSQRLR
jgi:anthranilate phosphoribosyltransferase